MKTVNTMHFLLAAFLLALLSSLGIARAGEVMQEPKKTILLAESEITWTDGPASLPPGTKIAVLEGDPKKAGPVTMRIKFPANSVINPHTHPADERLTVLSGTLYFSLGEMPDASNAKALTPGSFFMIPSGDPMFGFTTDEETIVQLNVEGPWGITYLDTVG